MYGLGSLSGCGSSWRNCPNRSLLVCVCALHSLPGLSSGFCLFPLQHVVPDRSLICCNKASSMWFWRRGKIYGTKVLTAMYMFSFCSGQLPSQTTARENTEDQLSLYHVKMQGCIVPTVRGLKGQPAASVIRRGLEGSTTYGMSCPTSAHKDQLPRGRDKIYKASGLEEKRDWLT